MTVRDILKMGDPRLLRIAQPVRSFDTPELHALIADMFETMEARTAPGWLRRRSASICSSSSSASRRTSATPTRRRCRARC